MSALRAEKLFSIGSMIAVITGGGSGIGLMMAKSLAENGAAKVYIVGRRKDRLQAAADLYPEIIIPICGDVTSPSSLAQVSTQIHQQTGFINLLICNAGSGGTGLKDVSARPTLDEFVVAAKRAPNAEFNDVYNINCTSVYYTVLEFLELLDRGNKHMNLKVKSQVIATASIAGYMRDPRWGFAYCSSKAALVSMMKSFSTYCVPWGIRFNSVAAGLFPTDMSMPLLAPFKLSKEKLVSDDGSFSRFYIPSERSGSEEDIAGTILYLVSRAGGYVNGSVLLLDGGKLAVVPATY